MKCYYHNNDLDGKCSGAIVKMRYPECQMIGINYGDEFPWETIEENEEVFMVDFSLQPFSDMKRLAKICNLTWIDHHITAIMAYLTTRHDPGTAPISATLVEGRGACETTWNCCFPEKSIPLAVQLLSQYDVWDHSDPRTLPFQYGMRRYDASPEDTDFWTQLFDVERVQQIVEQGSLLFEYEIQQNSMYVNSTAFETALDGLYCIAVNKMLTNSQLFDSIWDPRKYDAMLTFGWRSGKWVVSLYATEPEIDVSIIAKNHGGGGHKHAAGFQCDELPFKLN